MTATKSKWATVDQVAEFLNCSTKTVRRMIARRDVRSSSIGRAIRVDMDSVNTYMDTNAVEKVG